MASRGQMRDEALGAIGAAIDGAQDAPTLAHEGDAAPFGAPADDEGGGHDAPPLPPDCPVTCLGVLDQRCWYLDYNGQIIPLDMGNKHGKNSLIGLFGPREPWLWSHFAQWSKPQKERVPGSNEWIEIPGSSAIIGFDQARASRAMIIECTRKGIFDPAGRIRGAGAHRGANDALILHCGNTVMRQRRRINGEPDEIEFFDTGLHGEHVYPAAAAIPRPWPEIADDAAGTLALDLLRKWHWKRPQLDPLLVLGGIGASLVGGALDWRSNIWITGGPGTGKSSLNGKRGVLDQLFGGGRVRSANASAAYLRQRLRNATVPVFLDELESRSDNRHNETILELARISSSGDDAGRGGADHQAAEFTLQSAFWASSILIPPMEPADRSRWAICQLMPIPVSAPKPDLKPYRLPELGRKLLRRMVDGWHRWEDTLERYVEELGMLGHNARACAQFGTLLAAADLLMYDVAADDETIAQIASHCGRDLLREVSDAAPEHELCLNHLRTSMVQSRGGDERQSVGSWIGGAVQDICEGDTASSYHKKLQEMGLKVVMRTEKGTAIWEPGQRGYLAIANSHQALQAVFASTKWANGVWAQALGYTPGAVGGLVTKFARMAMRGMLVPLEAVIDESEIPPGKRWPSEGDA